MQHLPLTEPHGGFRWTDELRAELPVVRGVHVPPGLKPPEGSDPAPEFAPEFAPEPASPSHGDLSLVAKAFGRRWRYWGASAAQHNAGAELRQADLAAWQERIAQCAVAGRRAGLDLEFDTSVARWAVETCIALHGLPFALQAVIPLCGHQGYRPFDGTLLDPLREAIALAGDAAYRSALAEAQGLWRSARKNRQAPAAVPLAYAFAHVAEWADECLARQARDLFRLATCAVPAARYNDCLQEHPGGSRAGILLQVLLHGEAAFESLGLLFEVTQGDKKSRQAWVELLGRMRIPQLLPALMLFVQYEEVRGVVEQVAEEFPAATLRHVIATALAERDTELKHWAVRMARDHADALPAALAALEPTARRQFEKLLPASPAPKAAAAAKIPAVLSPPPWLAQDHAATRAGRQPFRVKVQPGRLEWDKASISEHKRYKLPDLWKGMSTLDVLAKLLNLTEAGAKRVLAGDYENMEVQPDTSAGIEAVFRLPAKMRLAFWNHYPASHWNDWEQFEPVQALIATYGVEAVPGLRNLIAQMPENLELAIGVDDQRLVEPLLMVFRAKGWRHFHAQAQDWITGHADTVLRQALPAAVSDSSASEDQDARHAVRWLASNGQRDRVEAVAREYGPGMVAAVSSLLSPESAPVPEGRVPKLPAFFTPGKWRRPELVGGGALPPAAVEHLCTMLAMSTLAIPYPALAVVKDACTPASLAAFAWDLFDAWLGKGGAAKDAWALTALGLLGDDEAARALGELIPRWAERYAPTRAATGLDVLAAIGTPVALMQLGRIAAKASSPALRKHARDRLAALAQARGLSPEQMADELVPDLGLDAEGALELNFGRRRFRVTLDSVLRPVVHDGQGTRLKDLPAPNRADDPDLAEAAVESFKRLKKEARSIASLQARRLELAMATRRRWAVDEFRELFAGHPLMRQLAARLAWGVYKNDQLSATFRIAEDGTLADAGDKPYRLPKQGVVGIVHVLDMDKRTNDAWMRRFAGSDVEPPFSQLGRETFALTVKEKRSDTLTRYWNRNVEPGALMGLLSRGWVGGEAESKGRMPYFTRDLPGGFQVEMGLIPGIAVDEPDFDPWQSIPELVLWRAADDGEMYAHEFGQLHPVLASEVLRDIERLASA